MLSGAVSGFDILDVGSDVWMGFAPISVCGGDDGAYNDDSAQCLNRS